MGNTQSGARSQGRLVGANVPHNSVEGDDNAARSAINSHIGQHPSWMASNAPPRSSLVAKQTAVNDDDRVIMVRARWCGDTKPSQVEQAKADFFAARQNCLPIHHQAKDKANANANACDKFAADSSGVKPGVSL